MGEKKKAQKKPKKTETPMKDTARQEDNISNKVEQVDIEPTQLKDEVEKNKEDQTSKKEESVKIVETSKEQNEEITLKKKQGKKAKAAEPKTEERATEEKEGTKNEQIKQTGDNATEKSVTEVDEKEYKKVEIKKKSPIVVISIAIAICLIVLFSTVFALININNNKIMSGISIMGIDVAGLTQEEAKQKLEIAVNDKLAEDLDLKCGEYETTVNGNQFSSKFDIDNAISQAYNIGRKGNIITNNYQILYTMIFKQDIEMPLYLNEEGLNKKIEDISAKIPNAVKQSSYYIEDDELIIVKGKRGIVIEEEQLHDMIKQAISQISTKYDIITIPTKEVDPDPIDLEKIRKEIYKEPKNAYVSKNPTEVHTHVNGVDFKISIEEAQKLLEEDKEEYVIPLKITTPEKTIKDLGEEAFPSLLSTYTTRYDPSNKNRSNNLSIAADKIDGTIMMPGETFSYNKIVGARTIEAGYKSAGAYAGGKLVQDIGGGICQVSSTLYNTALLANLEIVDRSNHQFLTGYVAASRDATVSWGNIDFKFKNTRTYPIKITASATNGVCKISIYGIKEETEYEVVIQSKITSYIPYTVKYEEDSSLAEGKEVVEQSGYNGCKSEAYRILKKNGKIVSKTLLSRDTYDPMQRIVRRGTKKTTKTSKETTKKTTDKKATDQKADTDKKNNND